MDNLAWASTDKGKWKLSRMESFRANSFTDCNLSLAKEKSLENLASKTSSFHNSDQKRVEFPLPIVIEVMDLYSSERLITFLHQKEPERTTA
jgi:hypothetical protein